MAESAAPATAMEVSTRDPKDSRGPTPGVAGNGDVVLERDQVRLAAAKLFGQGFDHNQIARILVDHLVPVGSRRKPLEQKLAGARKKLKRWKYDEEFRNLVYENAVVELDMGTPQILKGIFGKARKGNVQAARLALEVTGRHDPKGEAAPTQVVVAFGAIPRPEGNVQAVGAIEVEPDLEEDG